MASRERKEAEEPGVPLWVVTYGDMMSLLLCFFILLVAFSETRKDKLEQALTSFQGALGVLPAHNRVFDNPVLPVARGPVRRSVEDAARRLQERLQERGRDKDIKLEYDGEGGLRITLPSQVLFDSASARLRAEEETRRVLSDVAETLSSLDGYYFEVRGHTDNRPLSRGGPYRDNYELSFARAMEVARYLNETGEIPMEKFEIVACGPSQPIAGNDTPEGQAANRRVDVHVRSTEASARASTPAAAGSRRPTGER